MSRSRAVAHAIGVVTEEGAAFADVEHGEGLDFFVRPLPVV